MEAARVAPPGMSREIHAHSLLDAGFPRSGRKCFQDIEPVSFGVETTKRPHLFFHPGNFASPTMAKEVALQRVLKRLVESDAHPDNVGAHLFNVDLLNH